MAWLLIAEEKLNLRMAKPLEWRGQTTDKPSATLNHHTAHSVVHTEGIDLVDGLEGSWLL